MRLICPNCDAQYEVDDSAIPVTGRDVQCSNCGHGWFQMPEGYEDDLGSAPDTDPAAAAAAVMQPPETTSQPAKAPQQADDADQEAEPETSTGPAPKRALDESLLAVLREEAELEASARKAEATGIEMQGDLGLPPPVPTNVNKMQAPDMSDAEKRVAMIKGQPVPPPKPAARRDLLPDIEEINSSLRPNDKAQKPAPQEPELEDLNPKSRSGFRSGFVLMLLLALIAVMAYVMAPKIVQQFPAAEQSMAAYVAAVDNGRVWLDELIRKATAGLNGLTSGNS